MMRCPRCDGAVEAESTTCASCGQVLGGTGPVAVASRPAHMAVLDGVKTKAAGELESAEISVDTKSSKPRLVSRAGPAVPVTTRPDDSVPSGANGWLARLEAAKRGGLVITSAENTPIVPVPSDKPQAPGPPPLKKRGNGGKDTAPAWTAKPAHLLVAELEQKEREKREKREAQANLSTAVEEISKSEIAQHEIEKPQERAHRRKVPTWAWVTGLVASVAIAGGIALYFAMREPPPPPKQLDPELIAKSERVKQARAAVEEGHNLFQAAGDDKAKIDLAIAKYQQAVALEPDLARAERALGVAYAKRGDDELAVQHYKRFVELEPNNPEASQVRAFIEKYEKKKAK